MRRRQTAHVIILQSTLASAEPGEEAEFIAAQVVVGANARAEVPITDVR